MGRKILTETDKQELMQYTDLKVSEGGGSSVVVDAVMSDYSINPVQNKVVKKYVDDTRYNLNTQITYSNGMSASAGQMASQAMQVAKGRATGYVFDTEEDMRNALNDAQFVSTLVMGDNLYIRDVGVPDYWWDATEGREAIYPLETQKVNLTEYVKKESFVYDEATETLYITL